MNRKTITLAAILLVVFDVSLVRAAEWSFEPAVRIAGEYDDNADLAVRTDSEREISGYVADISARFGYLSPLTSFYAVPRFRSRQYGEPDFDSDDGFLRFGFNRSFKSSRFSIRGSYSNELARTAERADVEDLDVEDPETAASDDSSVVFLRGRRDRFEIAPAYSFSLSRTTSMGVELVYTDTRYDEDLFPFLNDYTDARAYLTLRRRWSAKNTAIFGATARNYNSDCPVFCDNDVSGYGIFGGFENRLSETTTFRGLVGLENTELPNGEDNVSPIANLTLTRRLETITLFAQYRREIAGGGGGSLLARDTINLNFNRQLNDRFSAGLGVRGYATSTLEEGQFNIDERKYIQLRALLEWKLSDTFSVETHYRYTVLARDILGESSNSNNVMLWFNWRPVASRESR